jgi:hypothetical protein
MKEEEPMDHPEIRNIVPTVFLKEMSGGLHQRVLVEIDNPGAPTEGHLSARTTEDHPEIALGKVPTGLSTHEFLLAEIPRSMPVEFVLRTDRGAPSRLVQPWEPVRHWVVHVIQQSHHDVGYSDLPSTVLEQHVDMLDEALRSAEATEDYPEESKFRIVIEQNWSLERFLATAAPDRVEKMLAYLRSGRFEVTALFGNMTTEICGHEEMARMLYPAFRLQREHGIPIVSAGHNDITGFSWGLSRILTDAGVKIFCPGIPLYYSWTELNLPSFWDEKALFPHGGPGAFWWEAPTGKRILFWSDNDGCSGDHHPSMPTLPDRLRELDRVD